MSTKTTFKRVALVTVAALGLGVMSVAPSNAAAELDSVAVSAASTTQNTTETLTATAVVVTGQLAGKKGVDTLTVTASIVSGPAYVAPVLVLKETTTSLAGGTSPAVNVTPLDTATTTLATAKWSLYLNAPSVAGTYVVKLTPTGGTNAVATTVSIVVAARVYDPVSATHSRVYVEGLSSAQSPLTYSSATTYYARSLGLSGETAHAMHVATTAAITTVQNAGTIVAAFGLVPRNESGTSTNLTRTPITVAVTSGPGLVGIGADLLRGKSITESVATAGVDGYSWSEFRNQSAYFISDGTGGTSVVTITMGGVLLKTITITQTGTTTAYTFGTPSKTVTGVGETSTVTIAGADTLGTTTGTATAAYAFSSDTSVATVTVASGVVTVTGVKSGTATITAGNAATIATSTITKTLAIKVGAITAKTVAFTMSPTAPQPGEKVTLTVTATDASGNAVGDGSRNLFTSAGITTSLAVQGATWTAAAAVTLKDGKGEFTFYAPTGTGVLTLTATQGAALDNVIADATTAAAITGSVTITNAAVDAATVAAEAAEAAAQDATDAALDATTAAEAAGALAQEAVDLVTELSAEVTKLIAGVRASITYLTKLVMKLAAKK